MSLIRNRVRTGTNECKKARFAKFRAFIRCSKIRGYNLELLGQRLITPVRPSSSPVSPIHINFFEITVNLKIIMQILIGLEKIVRGVILA